MKIAIVSAYPPSMGTLNEYNFHLTNHFKNKDGISEIHLFTDTLPNGEAYPETRLGPKVFIHDCWTFNAWTNPLKIAKKAKKLGVDIVLFNIQFLTFGDKKIPAALGLMTPMYMKWRNQHSVVLLHNILEEVDLESAGISKNPIINKIYNAFGTFLTKCLLKADLMTVTISKYVEVLEKKYQKTNIALTPHGSFEVPPLPDFNYVTKPMSVMAFGKFGTYKKVEVMIEAVEDLRKRTGVDCNIVIAGSDNPNAKGYLDSMKEKYSHVSGLIFTGYVAEEDIPRLFKDSTVVVFPYNGTTGSSGILHQAGSYGKAVVMPKIGDLEKLMDEEGYHAELFKPDDVESLSTALEKVLLNPEHRKFLGQQNYFAATSLPMEDITDWYYLHFLNITGKMESVMNSIQPQYDKQKLSA